MFKEELIIVRHGRSLHNVKESEDLDSGLCPWGERQARNVGKFLRQQGLRELGPWYTSPMLRCLQTTRLMDPWGRPEVMSNLREYINHCGDDVYVDRRADLFAEMNWHQFPHGATYYKEHNEVFLERMYDAYEQLPSRAIVVTHGLPAITLLKIASENTRHVPMWDHSLDNCSITWIRRGRVLWHGRNLYHEVGEENFDKACLFDVVNRVKP